MEKTFERHLKRIEYLKKHVKLVQIWECKYDKMLEEDDEFFNFVKKQKIRDPLQARDALFGGEFFVN